MSLSRKRTAADVIRICMSASGNGDQRRQREAAAYDLSPIIRRYGKELLLKVLGS